MQSTATQGQNLYDQYALLCGLNSSGEPVMTDDYHNTIDQGVKLGKVFADSHDNYARTGVVIGAQNNGGQKAILEKAFNSFVGNGSKGNALILAQALAAYWATVALIPKVAVHDLPLSVTNDAASKVGAFYSAIMSGYTTREYTPYFVNLFDRIESVVFTIIWTVIEIKITSNGPVVMPPYFSTIK